MWQCANARSTAGLWTREIAKTVGLTIDCRFPLTRVTLFVFALAIDLGGGIVEKPLYWVLCILTSKWVLRTTLAG